MMRTRLRSPPRSRNGSARKRRSTCGCGRQSPAGRRAVSSWQSAGWLGIVAARGLIHPRRSAGETARMPMMPLVRRSVCGMFLALAGPAVAHAQDYSTSGRVVIIGESPQARNRLRAIDRLLDPIASPTAAARCLGRLGSLFSALDTPAALAPIVAERPSAVWEQAEEAYHDLLRDSGDALTCLPSDPDGLVSAHASVQVRRLCHLRLATLPAVQLAAYRQRVDSGARRLLALGRQNRDPAPLRRLVDEMFCSRVTGPALDLLGHLAFEQGDFDEARAWWRRIALLPSDDYSVLAYPGPTRVDRVRVQAKQILALAFAGRLAAAQAELAAFHQRYGDARGALAGTTGRYSEIVHLAIEQVIKAGIANNADPWTTFAGASDRNHVLTVCPPPALWEDGPSWRIPLPARDPSKKATEKNAPAAPMD